MAKGAPLNSPVDLDRFYSLLTTLAAGSGQGVRLADADRRSFPGRGVYFFRELSERRSETNPDLRIVRVGTHAVSGGSRSTLWGRLSQHRGTKAGSGNHRGSIFRRHVGAALLARESATIRTWGCGSSAPSELRADPALLALEMECERRVSGFIGAMSILWVDVPDDAGPSSQRAALERNAIALLSGRMTPTDRSGDDWLGRYSVSEDIRNSGLWNVNYVREGYDPRFLDELERAVARTLARARGG